LIGATFKEKPFSYNYEMYKNTTFAVNAIVAALAMFGVVAITMVTIPLQIQQQAEAAKSPGAGNCGLTPGFNASQGHCFHPK